MEPVDDGLDVIEATINKMIGNFTRKEDGGLTTVFDARVKRCLNRVFDVIGFVYPEYSFPVRDKSSEKVL